MNQQFWRDKRILITGHTGFKGSWLSVWLQMMGADVIGYALSPPTPCNLFESARIAEKICSYHGDILDLVLLQQVLNDNKPEIIFHMAAQSLVQASYVDPVNTYATNVMGTVHLLEAARHTPSVKAIVNITSDKCYENREWLWGYREHDALGGYDPYSNSKGCSELVSTAFRSSYFNPNTYEQHGVALATARAGNVIGGGDYATNRLIPDILAAFQSKTRITIRNPHSIRPWQHVLEPLRGYLVLAEKLYEQGPRFAEAWNFGPIDDEAKSVSWIVQRMIELYDEDVSWEIDEQQHPHEAHHLKLDISKSISHLNWKPILTLDETLQLVMDWFNQLQKGADPRHIMEKQLDDYIQQTIYSGKLGCN
ncbi:MAG: CDP-glucose 4,6-dehydratase [Legionellaceae bacterium]|nr:CDP-glucose 4,6-dehydratase [Legionellaceae bacterium]